MTTKITSDNISPGSITVSSLSPSITLGGTTVPKITNIQVTNSSYVVLDDTAVDIAGGYIKITGTDFASGCNVLIGTVPATAVTFVSSTEVRVQVPATAAGTYVVYLVNSDGGVAIRINGITFSGVPSWVTDSALGNAEIDSAVNIQFSANGAATYSLAAGSSLPSGLTLSNVGLLTGSVTGLSNETTYNFTINAIDAELQDTPRTFSITITINDIYLNRTSLLLQSNVSPFNSDASTNAFPITVNGDTRPNNFNPFTPGYYSAYFDGTGDYLILPDNAGFEPSSSDLTWEMWINTTSSTQYATLYNRTPASFATGMYTLIINVASATAGDVALYVGDYTSGVYPLLQTTGVNVRDGTWHHIAVVRNGSAWVIYVDGISRATNTWAGTIADISGVPSIGRDQFYTRDYVGYISNLRIIKGTAIYTSSFTPPTSPLTAVTNTVLLTCQSNRFIDNSTNNFTITRNGNTSISGFDPFLPSTEFSGRGSAYFDGTGDVLTTTMPALGTGSFTIEFWFYPTDPTRAYLILDKGFRDSNLSLHTDYFNTRTFYLNIGGGAYTYVFDSSVPALNQWNHIAICRDGSSLRFFMNGVQLSTTTTNSGNVTTGTLYIGGASSTGSGYDFTQGYISNLRFTTTAVYTSNFMPPSSPLTAVANTSLLTLQTNQPNTNSVFLDSSTNNFLITRNGNSTQGSFSPYGANWSNYFDGTGDYLQLPNNSALAFGSGDFTIECWVYVTSLASQRTIADFRASETNGAYLLWGINTSGAVFVYVSSSTVITSANGIIGVESWNHVALSRSGSSTRLYVNGTQTGSTWTDNTTYLSGSTPRIGQTNFASFPETFQGYISNFRLVKGTAVYTTNFTPTTAPLTAISGTSLLTCQSNQIVDASANNFDITRVGDVRVERFGPLPATTVTPRYSINFDGTGDYITIPYNVNTVQWWDADYTIEMWVYTRANAASLNGLPLQIGYGDPVSNTTYMSFGTQASGQLYFYYWNGGAVTNAFSTTTVPLNTWTHVAMVYNNTTSTLKGYISGTEVFSVAKSGTPQGPSGLTLNIGAVQNSAYNGYISNLRIVRGSMVYTGAFTPSVAPLTAVTNTQLLIGQSAALTDISTNNFTLTAVGDTRPTMFSPFGPSYTSKQPYVTTTYGGSMYFDGTGDSLATPDNSAFTLGSSGDFTIECWIYPNGNQSNTRIVVSNYTDFNSGFANRWNLGFSAATTLTWYDSAGNLGISKTSFPINAWSHVAIVRIGSTITMYHNGIVVGTQTTSQAYTGQSPVQIGYVANAAYFNGYISDLRIVKGQALYRSNFVPPPQPLLAVNNTVLLVNGTASGMVDSTTLNTLETVGGVQVNTSIKKYNLGSIYFDGSGDYLTSPSGPEFAFGTGDYTIEAWVYPTSIRNGENLIYVTDVTGGTAFGYGPSTIYIGARAVTYDLTVSYTLATNTWTHLAAARQNGTVRIFANGVLVGSGSVTRSCPQGPAGIGDYPSLTGNGITGYIDDLRITKGYARYTANFTPPNTRLLSK